MTPERLEQAWMWFWRRLERFLGATGHGLSVLMGREGLAPWGVILLVAGVCFGWINTPFGGGVRALRLPIVPRAINLDNPRIHPLSFGTALIALLLLIWLTRPAARWAGRVPRRLRRATGFHAAVGLAALCLAFWFFLVPAFVRPGLIEDLIEQTNELHRIKMFDNAYIKGNVGVVAVEPLTSDTFWDQMGAFTGSLGFGFWYTLLGGSCLLAAGVREIRRERARSPLEPARLPLPLVATGSLAIFLLLAGGALSSQSLVADVLVVRADTWSARGDYLRAHGLYRKARNLDRRLAINGAFLEKMGRAAYRAGDHRSPEAHFYLARRYRWSYRYSDAVFQLHEAIRILEDANRSRTLPAYVHYLEEVLTYAGRALYDQGKFQGAVEKWLEAYTLDPDSFEIPFFLAHAYFEADGVDQQRAIGLNEWLLGRVRDRIFRSDLYCNLGEAYYRQKDYAQARIMYERSLDMYNFVKDINYRAQKGMIGL